MMDECGGGGGGDGDHRTATFAAVLWHRIVAPLDDDVVYRAALTCRALSAALDDQLRWRRAAVLRDANTSLRWIYEVVASRARCVHETCSCTSLTQCAELWNVTFVGLARRIECRVDAFHVNWHRETLLRALRHAVRLRLFVDYEWSANRSTCCLGSANARDATPIDLLRQVCTLINDGGALRKVLIEQWGVSDGDPAIRCCQRLGVARIVAFHRRRAALHYTTLA